MDVIQREKAYRILKHYGAANQRRQLCEECAELIQAVCKYERTIDSFTAEKYTDVIMIEQIKLGMFNGVHSHEIENQINFKLDRQLERIRK